MFGGTRCTVACPENVTVPLVPRRVIHLGDNAFDMVIRFIEDVKQIQRTHEVAAVAKLRQQSNWTVAFQAGLISNQSAQFIAQRKRRIEKVIAAQE